MYDGRAHIPGKTGRDEGEGTARVDSEANGAHPVSALVQARVLHAQSVSLQHSSIIVLSGYNNLLLKWCPLTRVLHNSLILTTDAV